MNDYLGWWAVPLYAMAGYFAWRFVRFLYIAYLVIRLEHAQKKRDEALKRYAEHKINPDNIAFDAIERARKTSHEHISTGNHRSAKASDE